MILMIFSRIVTKIIKMICWRSYFSRISYPLRMFTKIVSSNLMMVKSGTIGVRNVISGFEPIQKNSSYQLEAKQFPVNSWIIYEGYYKQNKSTAHKEMTPSKFCQFNGFVKSILHFMYGLNLHVYHLSYNCIMALIRLKNHLQKGDIFKLLWKCCSITIDDKLSLCYFYNRLYPMETII